MKSSPEHNFAEDVRHGNLLYIFAAPWKVPVTSEYNLDCRQGRIHQPLPREFMSPRHVLLEIQKAKEINAMTVMFTGGEPTLAKHLPAYIRAAREIGIPATGIFTDGVMFSRSGYLNKLTGAGLDYARILAITLDPGSHSELTGRPEALHMALEGIGNALDADLDVVISLPVTEPLIDQLPSNISGLLERFPGVRGFELHTFFPDNPPGYDPSRLGEILGGILQWFPSGDKFIRFAQNEAPAPCIFDDPAGFSQLYAQSPLLNLELSCHEKDAACAECLYDHLCHGVHQAFLDRMDESRFEKVDSFLLAPVLRWLYRYERARTSTKIRRERFFADNTFTVGQRPGSEGETFVYDLSFRIDYNCNQRCLFCFIEHGCGVRSHTQLLKDIGKVKGIASGSRVELISISGGEPTLNRNLCEYVSQLKELDVDELSLQTNAVLLSGGSAARDLAAAGLDSAFVSLHSHDAALSDAITGKPGTFEKTIRGIERLREAGVYVYLSYVANTLNYKQTPGFIDFVAGTLDCIPVIFSYATMHNPPMMYRGIAPMLSKIKDPFIRAIDLCREHRIPYAGLAGECGVPPCILDCDVKYYPDLHDVEVPMKNPIMYKDERCSTCSLNPYCHGFRKLYIELFGDSEIKPVRLNNFNPSVATKGNRISFFSGFYRDAD